MCNLINGHKNQLEAANSGVVTNEMSIIAQEEHISPERLRRLVKAGEVVIPCNRLHTKLHPKGIGNALTTKINVNLGASKDVYDMASEMQKVKIAVSMGADAIMDLSTFGDTRSFRRYLSAQCPAILGSVPIYDALVYYNKPLKDITAQEWLDVARMHMEDGIDFLTIHVGMNRDALKRFMRTKKSSAGRIANIVSRGGSLMFCWMRLTGEENPFFQHYDELLDMCREYDVTLSLGDACRPGAIADAGDTNQLAELATLGELALRARQKGVQSMIEGPGHVPLNQIAANMEMEKTLCHNAPFYVLGPIVCDVAPGYDHITSAIGGAVAAWNGASFLCYVTPAEHLRLPSLDDVKEGIVAARIAAHAGDIAKGIPGAADWDLAMSRARQSLDWEKMFSLALEKDKPRRYRKESSPDKEDTCTMCGDMCAARNMNRILANDTTETEK
jgi:phosphomethylpyrimidine synthase